MTEARELSIDGSGIHLHSQNKEQVEHLAANLDELLEAYLHTLDRYDKAQRELLAQLSSGYMSLAQANFQSGSPAIRYGPDYYDERMQAIRKVHISEEDSEPGENRVTFSVFLEKTENGQTDDSESKTISKDENSPPDPSAGSSEPPPERPPNEDTEPDQGAEDKTSSTDNKTKSLNPLRWFGILVPPALRSAQSSFTNAVEGPIPRLLTLAQDLKNQQIEIGRVKKQIRKLEV